MAKKKKTIKAQVLKQEKTNEAIIFMVAYDVRDIKSGFPHFWKREKIYELLKNNHISGMITKTGFITPTYACKYFATYDLLGGFHSVTFDDGKSEDPFTKHKNDIDDMLSPLTLINSTNALLDTKQIDIDVCFKMEEFLVKIGSDVFQVNSLAFKMKNTIVVNYELINYQTGKTLNHNDIYGYSNNYNMRIADAIKYFDETDYKNEICKISDIIFFNVMNFFEDKTKHKYKLAKYTFVNSLLVMSNDIENPIEFFQNVVGAKLPELNLKDISASSSFNYYTKEYLGLVTNYKKENSTNILKDIQILEALKMILHLEMIIDFEINNKLYDIVNNQIRTGVLFYPGKVPIITLNLIDAVKETVSFARYKEGIDFKIKALTLLQNRKKNSNGKLLNVLLYVLALISSFQTLDVLEEQFNLQFFIGFLIICIIFVVLGIVWFFRENKK